MTIDDTIAAAVSLLKSRFVEGHNNRRSLLSEAVPLCYSKSLPIENDMLESLHKFARANLIYLGSYDADINEIPCRIYEGDINNYWLSSKKHDTSYQPFYPTWMLSAFTLALKARSLGFHQLLDIGSGDGRIAYCASILGMEAYGIEIDDGLVELQNTILSNTGTKYHAIRADATVFDYSSLDLSSPIFFISGLPEMGEMLANSVIRQVLLIDKIKHNSGFNFMGSHVLKPLTRDRSGWGWGSIIESFGLQVICTLSLPTLWTTDQALDTAYVYTQVC
ncbi:MAG: class I SAM-dependent methyltransferase [Thermoproteota archaeon]|nr:class I SAM-dependent methyltransferase [Thermoproteota archaeon]